MRRSVATAVGLIAVLSLPVPAAAGGSWLVTLEESYEPGDEVIAVGYVGAAVADDVFVARINLVPMSATPEQTDAGWMELGPVEIDETGLEGYLASRVSITFTLPGDLEPGSYMAEVRNGSGNFFGDLIGVVVMVSEEPEGTRWIEWPLDEPLIAELPDDAVIAGPGFAVSVSDLRASHYPPGAEQFMLNPELLPPSPATGLSMGFTQDTPRRSPEVPEPEPASAPVEVLRDDPAPRPPVAEVTTADTPSATRLVFLVAGLVALAGVAAARRPRPRVHRHVTASASEERVREPIA